MIKVSRHAEMRIRERQGLNKKAIERMAQKAFDKGIKTQSDKGQIKQMVDIKIFCQSASKQSKDLRRLSVYI